MDLEVSLKAQKLKEKKGKKDSGLLDRIKIKIKKDKNKPTTEKEKQSKFKKKTKELALKALKAAILSIRIITSVLQTTCVILATLGTGTIFLFAIILICVIAAGAFIVNLHEKQLDLQNKEETEQVEIEGNNTDINTQNGATRQAFGDNTTWVNACESMFDWYYNSIDTYQGNKSGKGSGTRSFYVCNLFDSGSNVEVGDDCSAFVYACLAYAGFVDESTTKSAWGSSVFADETNSTLLKYFNPYHPDDYGNGVYKPRQGDILAYCGHVEIIAQVEPGNCASWSWGSVAKNNPCLRTGDINTYLHKMWKDNSHDVKVIWSLKDGVSTLSNSTVVSEGDGGTASSGGKTYGGVYSGENGYHHYVDPNGEEYDFTNKEWTDLMKHYYDKGDDGEIDAEYIKISSHTIKELFEVLGKEYPPPT